MRYNNRIQRITSSKFRYKKPSVQKVQKITKAEKSPTTCLSLTARNNYVRSTEGATGRAPNREQKETVTEAGRLASDHRMQGREMKGSNMGVLFWDVVRVWKQM